MQQIWLLRGLWNKMGISGSYYFFPMKLVTMIQWTFSKQSPLLNNSNNNNKTVHNLKVDSFWWTKYNAIEPTRHFLESYQVIVVTTSGGCVCVWNLFWGQEGRWLRNDFMKIEWIVSHSVILPCSPSFLGKTAQAPVLVMMKLPNFTEWAVWELQRLAQKYARFCMTGSIQSVHSNWITGSPGEASSKVCYGSYWLCQGGEKLPNFNGVPLGRSLCLEKKNVWTSLLFFHIS